VLHTPLQDPQLRLGAGPRVRWRRRRAIFPVLVFITKEEAPFARKTPTSFNAVRVGASTSPQLSDEHSFSFFLFLLGMRRALSPPQSRRYIYINDSSNKV
jgi:hypothetical protein